MDRRDFASRSNPAQRGKLPHGDMATNSVLGSPVDLRIPAVCGRRLLAGRERMASVPLAVINVGDEIHQRQSAAVRPPLTDRFA